jgi:PAS domain S-box-containing protein
MEIDRKEYNLLIVEDNPGDFLIVEDLISERILNPRISHARNYGEAVILLSDCNVVFDIILLDLTLPDKYGDPLIADILRVAPLCPVIILTGYADIDFSIKSISQGIFDYLVKDDLTGVVLYKSIVYAIERNKIIAELKQSEKKAKDLFDFSPQPMMVYDPKTLRIVQTNKAAVTHYGYTEVDFLKLTVMDLEPKDEVSRSAEIFDGCKRAAENTHANTIIHRRKSGELIDVELFSSPLIINGMEFRVVVIVDVTERNLYEQRMMQTIIKTQEEERFEIGSELHDNVCQILAVCQLYLDMLRKSIIPAKMPLFEQCTNNLSLAGTEIRNLSHRLAPSFFEESNLQDILKRLIDTFKFNERFSIRTEFDEAINSRVISREIKLNLYRILQEQLRNIQKYSNAGLINVALFLDGDKLKMKVSDDGVGFNVNTVRDGIGLANMKRRTELFSGKFEIESSVGAGCVVNIEIPLLKQAG